MIIKNLKAKKMDRFKIGDNRAQAVNAAEYFRTHYKPSDRINAMLAILPDIPENGPIPAAFIHNLVEIAESERHCCGDGSIIYTDANTSVIQICYKQRGVIIGDRLYWYDTDTGKWYASDRLDIPYLIKVLDAGQDLVYTPDRVEIKPIEGEIISGVKFPINRTATIRKHGRIYTITGERDYINKDGWHLRSDEYGFIELVESSADCKSAGTESVSIEIYNSYVLGSTLMFVNPLGASILTAYAQFMVCPTAEKPNAEIFPKQSKYIYTYSPSENHALNGIPAFKIDAEYIKFDAPIGHMEKFEVNGCTYINPDNSCHKMHRCRVLTVEGIQYVINNGFIIAPKLL